MKKIICLVFATLVLMMSAFTFSVSAEDTTSPDYIYFQVPTEPTVAWKNFSLVYCHIWSEGNDGADFYAWQAKDERCEDLGNGYWRYDITKLDFKEDSTYSLIFSNENGMQTYNLSFTSACKGDIVVCEGDMCVNPVDSEKNCAVARWMENKDKVFPSAQIGSDGAMLDPDGVFNADIDRKWGNSDGVTIAMPEVVVPTEPETEPETQAQTEAQTEITDADDSEDSYLIWYIIGGAALLVIALVVVLSIVIFKKRIK